LATDCNPPSDFDELRHAIWQEQTRKRTFFMIITRKTAGIAATAAVFALSAASAFAADAPAGSSGAAIGKNDTVHCYGVNSCKGTADCKTMMNECKGMNACKGHGFKAIAAGQCLTRGGTIGDIG